MVSEVVSLGGRDAGKLGGNKGKIKDKRYKAQGVKRGRFKDRSLEGGKI